MDARLTLQEKAREYGLTWPCAAEGKYALSKHMDTFTGVV